MSRQRGFLAAEWSKRWDRSYAALAHDRQEGVDKVAIALIKQEPTLGMRVKPIQPDGFYSEARVNDGDRLIFRIEQGTVWFIDVVTHDEIARYGKQIAGLLK